MRSFGFHPRRLFGGGQRPTTFAPGRTSGRMRDVDKAIGESIDLASDYTDPTTMLSEVSRTFRGSRRRPREIVVVLPRYEYAFRRFDLPLCGPEKLSAILRHQVTLNCLLGGDVAYFDYVSIPPIASQSDSPAIPRTSHAVSVARASIIEQWRNALAAIDCKVTAVTTQSQLAAEAYGSDSMEEDVLIVLADQSGVETLAARKRLAWASSFHEWGPDEAADAASCAKIVRRCLASLPEDLRLHEIVICGARVEHLAEFLEARFPTVPRRLEPVEEAAAAEGAGAWLPLCPLPSNVNLLRHVGREDPDFARSRRRRMASAACVLAALAGLWRVDARLRALDQTIAERQSQLVAAQTAVERGQTVASDYDLIQSRWSQRRDWLADLERLCGYLETRDSVVLTALQAEIDDGGENAEIGVSGVAPDTPMVTSLMSQLAQDATNVRVVPLGLRPIATSTAEAVEFQVRIAREGDSSKANGAP